MPQKINTEAFLKFQQTQCEAFFNNASKETQRHFLKCEQAQFEASLGMPPKTICSISYTASKIFVWHNSYCLQNIFVAFLKIASKTILWRLSTCLQNVSEAHKNATNFTQAYKNMIKNTVTASSLICNHCTNTHIQ